MHNIYVKDIIRLCDGKLIIGNEDIILNNFSKDTRALNKNDIYIGIKGENFDGNTLYIDALEKGALGCILDNNIELDNNILNKYQDRFIVLVNNTIDCIQKLASYKRDLYDIPVIGITGSVGKTSTKDIIASVLKTKYNVLSTIGNLNNHIGLPLTILSLKDEDCLVVEMGMNNLGEISKLSKIAKPTVGVITNIGTSHIGNLGSRENILKAKIEILDGMNTDGIVVINNDNDLLHTYYLNNKNNNIITYGINNDSNYVAENISSNTTYSQFMVRIDKDNYNFNINVPGEHFVLNALSAIAVGRLFDISPLKIKEGIENFALTKNRMEITTINDINIINDAYNANLDSMKMALKYLGTLNGRKIAILGDMLELGSFSEKMHREVAKYIIDNNIDIILLTGNYSKYIMEELNNQKEVYWFNNNDELFNKLITIINKNDNVLFKASNGMKFIDIHNKLKEYLTK